MRTSGPDILHNSKFEMIREIILSEYTFDKSVRLKFVEIIVDLFLKVLSVINENNSDKTKELVNSVPKSSITTKSQLYMSSLVV